MDLRNLLLPGGIGLSRIKVYEQPGPDGVIGGGAHFHSVSAESYYVVSGEGKLELLSYQGFEVLNLEPNMVIYFQPGVIHRVCNPNKNLVILSIRQRPDAGTHGPTSERRPDSIARVIWDGSMRPRPISSSVPTIFLTI